jgi:hypothetical protein
MAKTSKERGAFAGHETFPLRYGWLPKAVREVAKNPAIFVEEDAIVHLGVGKNMVRAIHHWGVACGMLQDVVGRGQGGAVSVSPLGKTILGENGWDPFMEDPATLWIAHHELAHRPDRATTWYWVFNLCREHEFSKEKLASWLANYINTMHWRTVSGATLERDIEVFVRTYVPAKSNKGSVLEDSLDSPLVELGLIAGLESGDLYSVQRDEHPSLPDEVFAYALARFYEASGSTAKTIPLRQLFVPGAPGAVFALSDDAVLARAERLADVTGGALIYQETAGLQQIYVKEAPPPLDLLMRHYLRTKTRTP